MISTNHLIISSVSNVLLSVFSSLLYHIFCRTGGYEYEFVDVPHDDDHCVICLLPARDPQQTKCECAKLYCKSCYDKLKTTSGTCPTCRRPLDAFPDRKSAKKVIGLRVKCSSIGCPWINELGSLNDHLQTCGYKLVSCAYGCGDQMIRNNLHLHTEVCLLRNYRCEHCKAEGPYKEMIGGHLDKCPDLMVPCPNSGCEVSIKRKDMASHDLECPHETISCPYKDVGCTYTSPRHAMADHKATSCCHHLDLAMVQLQRQKQNDPQDCTAWVFEMPQFNQFKGNKNIWYSPGFYTHTCGYKMCLRVHANGCGDDKGTHVSVFLRLMKGENDDALTWPIRYSCTITLLNQLRDKGHHSRSIISYIDTPHPHNSRVVRDESCGHWRGMYRFIPHDLLGLQEMKMCQYLKDDSLYFRVQVELIPAVKPWLVPILPS